MVSKKSKNDISIGECYELFNNEKLMSGVGKLNELCYFGEINDFLKKSNIELNDSILKIDKDAVQNWIIKMRGSNLSVGSINHNIRSIRVFIYWCMNNNYIDYFKISTVKGQEPPIKFCSELELKKLLVKPINGTFVEDRTYCIICFILATGARASTVCNIKVSDVDFGLRLVTYTHLKNKHIATVPISKQLERTLTYYLSKWNTNSEYLFCDIGGNQLTVSALRLSLARYCEKRKVKRKGPHSFRHTFAREWVLNGGNAFTLQQMLTHSDLSMTKKYVRLFGSDLLNNKFEQYTPLDNYKKGTARTINVKRRDS